MIPDLLSATLRAVSFITMAQTAGSVLFLGLFDSALETSQHRIRRTARAAALIGLIVLPAQFALEAGRMAGSLGGVLDLELQRFSLTTPSATVLAVRVAGMVLLVVFAKPAGNVARTIGLLGVLLIAVSFALIGHTATSPMRWLLGPLIVLHVLVVCFWFGALRPLLQVVALETASTAARVVERFSKVATLAVPLILIAGVIIAAWLLPDSAALQSSYGMGLVAKALVFALLMALATFNKWRLGPLLATGNARVRHRFSLAVGAEWVLIAATLSGTAILTTFLSPT
ncbi:MAG: CopD family protein [Pseudomonadota bacterium]